MQFHCFVLSCRGWQREQLLSRCLLLHPLLVLQSAAAASRAPLHRHSTVSRHQVHGASNAHFFTSDLLNGKVFVVRYSECSCKRCPLSVCVCVSVCQIEWFFGFLIQGQGDVLLLNNVARILEMAVPLMDHPSESFLAQLEEDMMKLILKHGMMVRNTENA